MARKKERRTVRITQGSVYEYRSGFMGRNVTTGHTGRLIVDGRPVGWVFGRTEEDVEREARKRFAAIDEIAAAEKSAKVVVL